MSEHLAVRWYAPCDIRVEKAPKPTIIHPDDALVKITLSGLCGSDLHVYRGHEPVEAVHTCGHEFVGEIVELGSSFTSETSRNRPKGYSTLKVGDKVTCPFSTNCGECNPCRLGFTCRCVQNTLLGTPQTPGAQAQYIRVPDAGGCLYSLTDPSLWNFESQLSPESLKAIPDSSLLVLSDNLPTGLFAAHQVMSSPKVLPAIRGIPFPYSEGMKKLSVEESTLTFAVIGLGTVGVCATIALLDQVTKAELHYKIVAIDLLEARREKMKALYDKIGENGKGSKGEFVVQSPEEAKKTIETWTAGLGCNAVLEVVGHPGAIKTAYELVRPFGAIVSVGVHGSATLPFTGGQLYDKNVSLEFGRCPVGAMFPDAVELLVKRQDVFGSIGEATSLVDRVVPMSDAGEMYRAFEKGEISGKVLFDPWK